VEYLAYKIDEVNNITEYEYALLMASIEEAMDEKKRFNCYHCKSKHEDKEVEKRERTIKGCYNATVEHKLNNVVYSYCIGNYCLPSTAELLSLFIQFEKGILPDAGGLLDQTAKTMQILEVITDIREEKRSKEENKTPTQRRVGAKLEAKRLRDGKRNNG